MNQPVPQFLLSVIVTSLLVTLDVRYSRSLSVIVTSLQVTLSVCYSRSLSVIVTSLLVTLMLLRVQMSVSLSLPGSLRLWWHWLYVLQVQVFEVFQLWPVSALFLHGPSQQETQESSSDPGVLSRSEYIYTPCSTYYVPWQRHHVTAVNIFHNDALLTSWSLVHKYYSQFTALGNLHNSENNKFGIWGGWSSHNVHNVYWLLCNTNFYYTRSIFVERFLS